VNLVDTAAMIKVLTPIWTAKPTTASRVRSRIEAILDWAKSQELRSGENPARWKGHLAYSFPRLPSAKRAKRKTQGAQENHPAMPYAEVAGFLVELRRLDTLPARALEFLILTAARSGEALRATWSEVDFAGKILNRPPEHMKSRKAHVVPLPAGAHALVGAGTVRRSHLPDRRVDGR